MACEPYRSNARTSILWTPSEIESGTANWNGSSAADWIMRLLIHSSTRPMSMSSAAVTVTGNPLDTLAPADGCVICTVGGALVPGPNTSRMERYEFCVLPPHMHGRASNSPHCASTSRNHFCGEQLVR